MKFATVATVASVAALAVASELPSGVPSNAVKFAGTAGGVIECDVEKKICSVTCGESLELVCTLIAVFDSVFYGIESLIGFTIDCTEQGCNVYCPVEGTVTCILNEAGATLDSVFAVGETLIIEGGEDLLGLIPGLSSIGNLIPTGILSGLGL